jgi:dephospho-CoA kinase
MQKKEGSVRIGLTGGIGAGKSVVCEVLINLNIPVYNADKRARFLMEHDPSMIRTIKETFSEKAYMNGNLDRAFLASAIFSDDIQLKKMNGIVHPAVKLDFEQWAGTQSGSDIIVKEAALLFESGSYKDLDKTILIYCPLEIRIKRILLRDNNRSREEVELIIEKQLSDTQKKKLAHYTITNDDQTPVIPQVLSILEKLRQEKFTDFL